MHDAMQPKWTMSGRVKYIPIIVMDLDTNPTLTWRSKTQSVISCGSVESEYRALALRICEGMWIQRLLNELGMRKKEFVQMFTDSQPSIDITINPVHQDRTKQIETDRHFISEKFDHGIIQLGYVPSRLQIVDILTKALPREGTTFDPIDLEELLFLVCDYRVCFDRKAFCLVNSQRFGDYFHPRSDFAAFRERVFPFVTLSRSLSKDDLTNVFNNSFHQLSNKDIVKVSLLYMLKQGFLGKYSQ
uniref:Uncharacterized protein n=1 Tax=Lactuca sativa TaxID=4236 RepID=A0A9R1VMN7_LACSA|nr:hypothetical protein LSAT_V11C400167670 [Lactuca sativa]